MPTDASRRLSRAEQQAETRARLADAAAEVFAERGVEGASIDEITQRAGYTRGAFYSNFDSKAALLVELCDARLQRFAEESLPAVVALPQDRRVGETARLLIEQGPQPEIALLGELARLRGSNPEVAELLDGFLARFVALVEQLLAEHGDQLGEPDLDRCRSGARALVAVALGVGFLRHLGVGADDAAHAAELLLEGTLRTAFPDAEIHHSDDTTTATEVSP